MDSSLSGTARTTWYVQTFVSVGPYQLCRAARGTRPASRRRYGVGKTSPAKTTCRREERSLGSTSPWGTSSISADGTEYHTVSPRSATKRAVEAPICATSGGTGCRVPPTLAQANRSNTERSKWNGAWLENRSSGVSSSTAVAHSTNVIPFRWESITPFGSPVDPEV